jgi:hypothetical protein
MAVEKVFVAPDFIGLEGRERLVTRRPLRPPKRRSSRSTFRRLFIGLFSLVTTGNDVMAEAHRLRREAERRWPHINFDT